MGTQPAKLQKTHEESNHGYTEVNNGAPLYWFVCQTLEIGSVTRIIRKSIDWNRLYFETGYKNKKSKNHKSFWESKNEFPQFLGK